MNDWVSLDKSNIKSNIKRNIKLPKNKTEFMY